MRRLSTIARSTLKSSANFLAILLLPTSGETTISVFQSEVFERFDEKRSGIQMIYWDIEKALDLFCMQVHCQDPRYAGFFQQIGH